MSEESIQRFIDTWKNRGHEKPETHLFWVSLLQDVLDIDRPADYLKFEYPVPLSHQGYVDVYLPFTKVLVEMKSSDVNLDKEQAQSDGFVTTPYGQAQRYANALPPSAVRYIIVCNFKEFRIYDLEVSRTKPFVVELENLLKEAHNLEFIADAHRNVLRHEFDLSMAAGDIVGKLYDGFLKEYKNPESPETLRSLNILCVRLVFCLYAEDAGIFGRKDMFLNYLQRFEARDMRRALIDLFKILDTKAEERDPYLDDDLAAFPYVNGGLFAEQKVEIPNFNDELKELLLTQAAANFDWSDITPTIFGAVFESTLNTITRRKGGMHYTSIENIHKVIDPLFLDDLKAELADIRLSKQVNVQQRELRDFRKKLGSLTFLDPACGSGNFLTETYLSLRQLENESLLINKSNQIELIDEDFIQVKIGQFYGIEINDFAVAVARTALWIAESQMMKKTKAIVHSNLDFLPLKNLPNIVEANALRIDWNDVVPKEKLNYIMGNPPFLGHQYRSKEQQCDMDIVFEGFVKKYGKLDYVCAWYKKACDIMEGTPVTCAFVSTNSIAQGESVATLFQPLFQKKHLTIIFTWQTFVWNSESLNEAHVHCVIVGFICGTTCKKRVIFKDKHRQLEVENINGYLLEGANLFIENRGKSLTEGMDRMSKGSQPTDGGHLILSEEEKADLIKKYPSASSLIRRYMSSKDFINNKLRYCLWLKGVSPNAYNRISPIMERLNKVAEARRLSPTDSVKRDAETPMLFTQIRQPDTEYLVVPEVSSERRQYIPIGFLKPEIIASNKLYIIKNADLYLLGILTSSAHNAWMRIVSGRLKSDYSYSPAVYNNFPWPTPTDAQKGKIKQTAQAILDARKLYPDCSLDDLYNEKSMPVELRRAHQANDKAVLSAYGFSTDMKEPDIVAELFKMYQALIEKEAAKKRNAKSSV